MLILGIETSCDETAGAVLKDNEKILSSIIFSQNKLHSPYGGVVPEVAARKHIEIIIPVISEALSKAKIDLKEIDLIAVTTGPGLITSLMIGVDTAKALAFSLKKPIVGINHLEAHIYSNFLPPQELKKEFFPLLCLVVSGGHTELVLMRNFNDYKNIGGTRDDAAGESFDKVAKLLKIGYPGGPIISKLADLGNSKAFAFPRPMIKSEDFDFSFSGLKTDVLRLVKKRKGRFSDQEIKNICASFQAAVVDVLVTKVIKAAQKYKIKNIALAGGVAANKLLRKRLKEALDKSVSDLRLFLPQLEFCTDNAAMVALAGYYRAKRNELDQVFKIKAEANLDLG